MSVENQIQYINEKLDYLMGSRPTAVDLSNAIKLLKTTVKLAASERSNGTINGTSVSGKTAESGAAGIREAYILAAEKILEDDLTTNLAIGRYGAEYLRRQQMPISEPVSEEDKWRYFTTSPPGTQGAPDRTYRKLSVLTHCNTGYVIFNFYTLYFELILDTSDLLQLPAMEQP
jgi:methylthioribose-1-phosphate isomerase